MLVELLAADVESLDSDAESAQGLLVGLEAERTTARQAVVEALSSERYLALLDRLDHVAEPELSGSSTTLREIAAAEWRRARRHVGALPRDPSDDELHAVRLRVKRARYAAELAEHELEQRAGGSSERQGLQAMLGSIRMRPSPRRGSVPGWLPCRKGVAAGRLIAIQRERKLAVRQNRRQEWDALRVAGRPLK